MSQSRFLGLVLASVFAGGAPGAVLVSVSGPNDLTAATTPLNQYLAVAFTLPTDFINVNIVAELMGSSGFAGNQYDLEAYLTTQVGPSTAAITHEIANEIGAITVAQSPGLPPYTITPVTVFSGLSLSAGTYYLVLGGSFLTTEALWPSSAPGDLITSTSGGASIAQLGLSANGTGASYLPGSNFVATGNGFWYQVTGDAAVPEPSTYALCALALLAIFARRAKRGSA